jgi:lipopolysaccharide transport protein LptA
MVRQAAAANGFAAQWGSSPVALTMQRRGPAMAGNSPILGPASSVDRARAFTLARRHSRMVKVLRLALPLAALVFTIAYILTLTASWKFGAGRLNVGQVAFTADDLTMKNPSYFGLTNDGGRYEVHAKNAVVELNNQAPIKLIDIAGDLIQANGVRTKLKATHGLFDNAKSELELFDGIKIDASNGLSARLSRAMVYSKEHRIVSKHPVLVTMTTGEVRGAAMTMDTATREATFAGDVIAHLKPAAQAGQGAKAAGLGRDGSQPVDVTSDQLYINDSDDKHFAQFTGSVVATQGDTRLKAPQLTVTYEGKALEEGRPTHGAPTQPAENPEQRLSRLLASGGSVITVGADRRISSDSADFDAKSDQALFAGNVLINQQKNVLQGRRLAVDRKSGKSHLDSPPEGGQAAGRIAATFYQTEAAAAPALAASKAKPKSTASTLMGGAQGNIQEDILGSFKTDPNAPIDIDADVLDVDDAAKQAVFHGKVKAQQGEFVIRTVELTAHYSGQSGLGLAGENGTANEAPAQLTRVDATKKVLITSKDGQSATGDWAIFDIKANTALLGGHVIVSRGKDVAEGPRLKIDLSSGMYRFELEDEPHRTDGVATSASEPATSNPAAEPPHAAMSDNNPSGRTCAPGKQCLLFFPKDAQDRAKLTVKETAKDKETSRGTTRDSSKDAAKKALPNSKSNDAWQPSTSASPALRSD